VVRHGVPGPRNGLTMPSVISRAAVRISLFASASPLLAVGTMTVYHVWSVGIYTFLILLPYLIALGSLGRLFAWGASGWAHRSLASTTVVLAVVTVLGVRFCVGKRTWRLYVEPDFCPQRPIFCRFPIVFLITWCLYGLNPKACAYRNLSVCRCTRFRRIFRHPIGDAPRSAFAELAVVRRLLKKLVW
jgi:hypothetical protein